MSRYVRRHLAALVRTGAALRTGSGRGTVYLARPQSERAAHQPSERQDEGSRSNSSLQQAKVPLTPRM